MTTGVWLVVVHYGDPGLTGRTLAAVEPAVPPARRVVVDNGAGWTEDGRALVLRSDRNLGFAGGANIGLAHAFAGGADFAWLLNNDASPEPDALSMLVESAGDDPATIVGAIEVDPRDADPQGPWVGRAPVLPPRLQGRVQSIGGSTARVDFLSGFSLLIGRGAWERIGPMDETYFHYFEDVDYSMRGVRAGVRLILDRRVQIAHRRATALGSGSETETYYFFRNRILLARRYRSGPGLWTWLTADPRHGILPLLSRRRLAARDWAWFRGAWLGTLDGLRGRAGRRRGRRPR
jgi:GT2 family glycosyltransferase